MWGIIRHSIFLVFAVVFSFHSQAQHFPVQVGIQLPPPHSLYLSDYVIPGSHRLSVNILLTELDRINYPVRLRITIEGNGIHMRTREGFMPSPMELQGGMLEVLSASELAPYFDPLNLQVSGANQHQFTRTTQLPEGFYRFCIEVLDYYTGTTVSNFACANAWLILNEPPIINVPQANAKVRAQEPQHLIFQWSPRHMGSPNAGFTTEYELTLVELWPSNRDPNDAIRSTPPVFQTTTLNTTFIYGVAEPALLPGRAYAFRVRAKSMAGVDKLALFKNQGYSETIMFTYGEECSQLQQVQAEALSATRIKLSWPSAPVHTAYIVRYREAGRPRAHWFEETTYLNDFTINSLKPDTEYEYQVKGLCGTVNGDYTHNTSIRTLSRTENELVCGKPFSSYDLSNPLLLKLLFIGDYVYAGDFDVQLTEVWGSNGLFSGEGIAEMPLLNMARVKVRFEGIHVNTDYRLIDGNIYALTDPSGNGILNLDEESIVKVKEKVPEGTVDKNAKAITIPYFVDSVYVNEQGQITVVDTLGKEALYKQETHEKTGKKKDTHLTDSSGKRWSVDKEGNVSETETNNNADATAQEKLPADTLPALQKAPLLVEFTSDEHQRQYGYDPPRENYAPVFYPTQSLLGETFPIGYKALSNGRPEYLTAQWQGADSLSNYITYQAGSFMVNTSGQAREGKQSLTLIGLGDQAEEQLTAYQKIINTGGKEEEVITGALHLSSYDPILEQLVIIPVNDIHNPYSVTHLQNKLTDIYSQAVVSWQVTEETALQINWDENGDEKVDDGFSGTFSNYTLEMKNILKAYKKVKGFDDDKYYLFLVAGSESGQKQGYMPRKRQAGFIFLDANKSEDEFLTTIAHELGHGAYRLEHIFKEKGSTPGQTDNLMDYRGGTFLHKYQWDYIHNPIHMIALFQDDDDGAYVSETFAQEVGRLINFIKCGVQRNKPVVDVYYGYHRYDIPLKDILAVLDFGNKGYLASDAFKETKLHVGISDGLPGSSFFFGYKETQLKIGQAKYPHTYGLFIPAVHGNITFKVPDDTDPKTKENIYRWLLQETGLDYTHSYKAFNVNKVLDWKAEDIFLFSYCELEQFDRSSRERLLVDLLDEQEDYVGQNKDTYQKVLLNVLNTIPAADKTHFYNLFLRNPQWVRTLYQGVSAENKPKLVKVWLALWTEHYQNHKPNISSSGKFIITNNIFGNASDLAVIKDDGRILFAEPYQHGKTRAPISLLISPFDPVYLYKPEVDADKPFTTLPAIAAKLFIDQQHSQTLEDLGWTAIEASLYTVGMGEVWTGLRGAAAAMELGGVASRKFLLNSARTSLGFADIAAGITTGFCEDYADSKFCAVWQEYQFYIDLGLLTTSVADGLYSRLRSEYSHLHSEYSEVSDELTDAQRIYLEEELGLVSDGGSVAKAENHLAAFTGKITKGGNNLLDIPSPVGQFRQLKGKNGKIYRAADFWKQRHEDFVHYISQDGKYYIKHDPITGRMLFLEIESQKFLGYSLDEAKFIKGNYDKFLTSLKTIHGLPGGLKVIKLKNGVTIILSDDKAIVMLGKYRPNDIPGIAGEVGTDDIIEDLSILKNYSFADNGFELRPGSLHVLNIPDGLVDGKMRTWETFFEDFNKELLDLVIKNPSKAKFVLVTYPYDELMFTWKNGRKDVNINNGLFIPSGYAKELKYLKENGITKIHLIDGSLFDLNQINLDNMSFDWTI